MKGGTLKLRYPYFVDQIEPKGRLLIQKECHACYYYMIIARNNIMAVGKGPESQIIVIDDGEETPLWMDKQLDQQARSVATLYQLESPEEFLVFVPQAMEEMKRQGFEVPLEVLRPFGIGTGRIN